MYRNYFVTEKDSEKSKQEEKIKSKQGEIVQDNGLEMKDGGDSSYENEGNQNKKPSNGGDSDFEGDNNLYRSQPESYGDSDFEGSGNFDDGKYQINGKEDNSASSELEGPQFYMFDSSVKLKPDSEPFQY